MFLKITNFQIFYIALNILINQLFIFATSSPEKNSTHPTTYQLGKFSVNEINKFYLRNLDHLITLKGDTSPIFGNTTSINYYYIDLYIGNPPQKQSLIIDTGSHITSVPCLPYCEKCGKHLNKYYDMHKSNESRLVDCTNHTCKNTWAGSCGTNNQCQFFIVRHT
jgi:hypothetical protein